MSTTVKETRINNKRGKERCWEKIKLQMKIKKVVLWINKKNQIFLKLMLSKAVFPIKSKFSIIHCIAHDPSREILPDTYIFLSETASEKLD